MVEKVRLDSANKLFVLRAFDEKCRKNSKRNAFCKYGAWQQQDGRQSVAPDAFFAEWVKRFTEPLFRDYVDTLNSEKLIEFAGSENNEVLFRITEKGRTLLKDGIKVEP